MAVNQAPRRGGFRHHFDWWERAYITDWLLVVGLYFLTLFIKAIPVFERDFDINDPLINHKFAENQRVPGAWLHVLTFWIPLFMTALLGAMKGSSHNFHHAALALCSGTALTNLIVDFVKNRVGRLRPDFLSRCTWDAILKECTGKHNRILDGRRSFPSGHSASAFMGLGFVFLILAGQTESLRLNAPSRTRSFLSSKLLWLSISLLPLLLATWIAITRLEDYRHHKEDVLVGSALGFSIAFLSYSIYWPNPFKLSTDGHSIRQPKVLYRPETSNARETRETRVGEEAFELAPMVEENQPESDRRAPHEEERPETERLVKDGETNGKHVEEQS